MKQAESHHIYCSPWQCVVQFSLVMPCAMEAFTINLDIYLPSFAIGHFLSIRFYAPWCSACQRFKEHWKEVAGALEQLDIEVRASAGIWAQSL